MIRNPFMGARFFTADLSEPRAEIWPGTLSDRTLRVYAAGQGPMVTNPNDMRRQRLAVLELERGAHMEADAGG